MSKAILNTTRQTCVAQHVEIADSIFTRAKGLMFRSHFPPDHGLWLSPCKGIHSCFLLFPFDALFLNKDMKILHLVQSMKPWRISSIVLGAQGVLELPDGCIARSETQIGDTLAWRE